MPGPHRTEHAEAQRAGLRDGRGAGTPLLGYSRPTVHAFVPLGITNNPVSLPCSGRLRQPWETPITAGRPGCTKPSQPLRMPAAGHR
ncbi:hypothetical protein SHJG_4715 [Streptomyces hygroscopicus subsp. jinggangensis 5008]|nr:hypothetical protein SHJG_4715 [Streptomyces hygroscopicus subsp. jinggangensis 5008]AGF64141.1 hypothetical protein SHJGH_4477 [Streptomyces hygroscopicus subsp. jinggangensis TL01]